MRKTLLLFTVLLFGLQGWAYDFKIDSIYYTINSTTNKTVSVVNKDNNLNSYSSNSYSGNVIIPSSVTYNGTAYAVTEIGFDAFLYCESLTSVAIPNSVISISLDAFWGCSQLSSITIPSTIKKIGDNAFTACNRLSSIIVDESNENYSSMDGVLFNKNQTMLIQYPSGKTNKSYSIPSTVTSIGKDAFNVYSSYSVSLTSLNIPSSVTSIGEYAFGYCMNLSSIYITNTIPSSITLGASIFSYVPTSTCTLYVPTGTKSLYTSSSQWSTFSNIVETAACTLSATANPTSAGLISGTGSFLKGSICSLTAKPTSGYTFISWTDKKGTLLTNSPALLSILVTKDTIFTANYTPSANAAKITIASNNTAAGTVSGSNGNYYTGTTQTITATVNTGYTFANWTDKKGNVVSKSPVFSFTLTQDTLLIANFTINKYNITIDVNTATGGSVTGAGSYDYFSKQTVTANPNDGYGFKNWINNKGNELSTSKNYSFTLTKDTALTANFSKTYDFVDNNGLYYKISSPTTAYVTYRNSAGGDYSGAITIPSTATINGISYNVTAIGDSAFNNCSGLTSISIANSVTSIGDFSFINCSNLPYIKLSDAITSIGRYTFCYCRNLESITLSNSLTTLSDGLFYGCSKLKSITIPNSVIAIKYDTFGNCSELSTVSISSSVVSIGVQAFERCSKLTSFTVDSNNPNYCSVDGVLFNKNKTSLIQYLPGSIQTSYSIPNTVTTIEGVAFLDNVNLTSIVIPSSVTFIKFGAIFYCTGLKAVYANNSDPGKIKLENGVFYLIPTSTCQLYVPTGSKSLYAAASQWKDFMNIVELPLYTITTSVNTSTGGNISGAGRFLSGNECTISALPNTGYSFANWTENGTVVSTDASYTFMVNADQALVANFTENNASDYTIAMSANPSAGGSTTGTGRYASGTTCNVSATANANYMFSNWTENGTVVSNDVTYTFTVNTARTLVANFIAGNTITAISNYSTRGSITGAGGYVTGESCTLIATANTGYIFSNWTENGTVASTKATYTFTVNAAHTFVASFVAGFIVNATADASQGNITGTGGYATGSNCTLQATPKTGYVFTGWTENGTVVSTNPSYTFTVSAARTLVANFSTVTVAVTQPTATTLSGSIVVTPSTGFTYSIDGKTYQNSNEFPYVSIGTYNVTLKNSYDGTVSSPVLAVINASGVVAANNYQIKASNCTCRDTKDGAIAVTLAKALDYTVTVTGINTGTKQSVMFSGTSYNLKNLPADTYKLVFKIDFLDNYEQSFNVVVTQPDDLSVLKVGAEKSRATYALSGGTNYYVSVNDNTTETQGDQVQVSLVPGENKIKIYTEKLCQGMYEETIYNSENGQISLFPNPTTGKITLGIPGEEESVTAEIISLSGAVELKQKLVVPSSRLVDLDVSDFSSGTYIVKVNGSTVHSSVKMIKK
jgi:uncharacterized repeat protein (TIGR02543 family)